jgi:hypothetical protein
VVLIGAGPEGSLATTAVRSTGGKIAVSAEEITLTDAIISATVSGNEPGGEVVLRTPRMTLQASEISAETRGAGNAGTVLIEADQLVAADGSRISSRSTAVGSGAGDGGEVNVRGLSGSAKTVMLQSESVAETSAVDGDGGDIEVRSRDLFLTERARIAAESEGIGAAGNIKIALTGDLRAEHGLVSTDARSSDGGNIDIGGGQLVFLRDNSAVTTSVGTGAGTGGNVRIASRYVVLDSSAILANAFGGPGGNVSIFANGFVPSADSIVEAIGKQSQIPGRIEIRAPDTDFIKSLAPLPQEFEDPSTRLGSRCSERRDVDQSSFVADVGGRLPLGPEAFLLGIGIHTEEFEFLDDLHAADNIDVDRDRNGQENLISGASSLTGCRAFTLQAPQEPALP